MLRTTHLLFTFFCLLSTLSVKGSPSGTPSEAEGPKKKLSLTPTDKPIDNPGCGNCGTCVNLLGADTLGLDFVVDLPISSLLVRATIRQNGLVIWTGASIQVAPLVSPGTDFSVVLPLALAASGLSEGQGYLELQYFGIANTLNPNTGSIATQTWNIFQGAPICLSNNCLLNPKPKGCGCKPCNTFGFQGGFIAPANQGGVSPRPFWGIDGENKMLGLTYYRRKGKFHYQAEFNFSQRGFYSQFDSLITPSAPPRTFTDTFRLTQFTLSPLQVRVPVKRLFSIGAGVEMSYLQKAVRNQRVEVQGTDFISQNYHRIEPGAFVDLRLGNPRSGLNVGLRMTARYGGTEAERQTYRFAQYYLQYLF